MDLFSFSKRKIGSIGGLECRKIGYEMLIVHLGTLCSTYQFHLLILHL